MDALREAEPPLSSRSLSFASDELLALAAALPLSEEELLAQLPALEALAAGTARALELVENRLLALLPPPPPPPSLPVSSSSASSVAAGVPPPHPHSAYALLPAPLVDWRVQQQVDVELTLEIASVMQEVRANNLEQMDKLSSDLQVRLLFFFFPISYRIVFVSYRSFTAPINFFFTSLSSTRF